MAEAFRRLLWLLPVLSSGAIVIFLSLGSLSTVRSRLDAPLFYNSEPISAELAAQIALNDIIAGRKAGRDRLKVLGGAALPTLLMRMPTLSIPDRRKLSLALEPVAKRMGLHHEAFGAVERKFVPSKESSARTISDNQLLLWELYRDEHGQDLRPLSVTRLARRFSQRDAQRRNADLLAVDTYALPVLVSMLGRISSEDDVARTRRLVTMISHLSDRSWTIPEGATPEEARHTVTLVRLFWDEKGAQWTSLDRFSLLVARFSQTEFAKWIFRSARQISGLDHSDLFERVSSRGRHSLPLLLSSLLGLLVIGPAIATSIQVLQLRQSEWVLEKWGLRAVFSIILVALIPLLLFPQGATTQRLPITALVVSAAFSAFTLHRELNDRLDWRTHHVLRTRRSIQRIYAVTRWIAPALPTLAPIFLADAALWVTCLEVSSRSQGMGLETILALKTGDLDFLMLTCLGLGLATGMAQVLADLLLGSTSLRQGET